MEFRVTWAIDVDAPDQYVALSQALQFLFSPTSTATVFSVNGEHMDLDRRDFAKLAGIDRYESTLGTLIDGVLTCTCGSTEFEFTENLVSSRSQDSNADEVLEFFSDGWDDVSEGDGSPGVVCLSCGRAIENAREVVDVQFS